MAAKRGRKSAYDTKIKPRFSEIAEWIRNGATEASVAKRLGISHTTWARYKSVKSELVQLLKSNREAAVNEIENSMYRAATGELRTVRKYAKCKRVEYENGRRAREFEEMVPYDEELYIPPNTTAAIYLLKHWGKNRGYTNDPLTLDVKKQELELKKKVADANNWLMEE